MLSYVAFSPTTEFQCSGCSANEPTNEAFNNGGPEVQVSELYRISGSCQTPFGICLAETPCIYAFNVEISGLSGSGWTKEYSDRNYPSSQPPAPGTGWRDSPEMPAENGDETKQLAPLCGFTREFMILLSQDGNPVDAAGAVGRCDPCKFITVLEP